MDRLAIKQLILTVAIIVFATLAVIDGAKQALAQDVAYCRHGQDGTVIVIDSNMACPFGYYRI